MGSGGGGAQRRGSRRLAAAVIVLLLASLIAIAAPAQPEDPEQREAEASAEFDGPTYTIAAGPPCSEYHASAIGLAWLAETTKETRKEFRLEVVARREGSFGNLEELRTGAADFAIAQGDVFFRQSHRKVDGSDLVFIASLFDEILHLIVRHPLVLEDLSQLKDKRVVLGEKGSGTRVTALMALDAVGITERDVLDVEVRDTGDWGRRVRWLIEESLADAAFLVDRPPSTAICDAVRCLTPGAEAAALSGKPCSLEAQECPPSARAATLFSMGPENVKTVSKQMDGVILPASVRLGRRRIPHGEEVLYAGPERSVVHTVGVRALLVAARESAVTDDHVKALVGLLGRSPPPSQLSSSLIEPCVVDPAARAATWLPGKMEITGSNQDGTPDFVAERVTAELLDRVRWHRLGEGGGLDHSDLAVWRDRKKRRDPANADSGDAGGENRIHPGAADVIFEYPRFPPPGAQDDRYSTTAQLIDVLRSWVARDRVKFAVVAVVLFWSLLAVVGRSFRHRARAIWQRHRKPSWLLLIVLGFSSASVITWAAETDINSYFSGFGTALWSILVWILSGFEERSPVTAWGRAGSIGVLGLWGIFLLLVVDMIVGERLRAILEGQRLPRDLRDHYVICNWNGRAEGLIHQLRSEDLRRRDGFHYVIVIHEGPLDLRAIRRSGTFVMRDVLFVRGDPTDLEVLKRVHVNQARSVLVLVDDEQGRDADGRTLLVAKALLGRGAMCRHVILELLDSSDVKQARSMFKKAGAGLEILDVSSIESRLFSQSAATAGLSGLMFQLTSYRKDCPELYSLDVPASWPQEGTSFRTVLRTFTEARRAERTDCTPVGVRSPDEQGRSGRIRTNPEPGSDLVYPGDQLVVLACRQPPRRLLRSIQPPPGRSETS